MTEFKISTIATPAKLNLLYNEIAEQELVDTALTLPGYLTKYRFGLLSDILKLVFYLNSKSNIKLVKINVEENELDKFYDQEYSYPIISLLWNISSFTDELGKDIKEKLRVKQNEFFVRMNSLSKFKGNKYILVNTDHIPKNKGLIRLLEGPEGFNDDEDKIVKKVKKILKDYILTFNRKNLNEIDPIIEDIGAIIFELVKNTFEWGRTDSNNVDLSPSIRGAYIRFHIGKDEKIKEEFKDTPLEHFFTHPKLLQQSTNDQQQIYYLEILVFDSGVGFVEKFGREDQVSDIDIIKQCLIKNQTSSKSNLKTKKGKGLDRILNILDDKGFLRITTDRYCLYRDLIKNKYEPVDKNNSDNLVLQNWNNVVLDRQNTIKSQGSFISILYPFKS